jgi:hypothetical protein
VDKLIVESMDKIAIAMQSIATSLEQIANPPIIVQEVGPHDFKICTCSIDPKSKKTCPIHGEQKEAV